MNLEKAQELQRLRAEHLKAASALLLATTAAAEVSSPGTLEERYHRLHLLLTQGATFYRTQDRGDWEVTPIVRVGDGAEPMTSVGLRFLRLPGVRQDGVPATIMAQWCHGQDGKLGASDENLGTFGVLEYGEPFATECVTSIDVRAASEGEALPTMPGDDPRPVEERMALLEQSAEVFFGAPQTGAGPQ